MTDQTGTTTRPGQISRPDIRQTGLLRQSLAIARRNFIHIKRMPEMLMDVTIQPVMFVLLFAFVFGSSIAIPIEGGYKAFLTDSMPDWLRTVAEWNPISALTQAVRELWGNDMPLHADAELPLRYPIVFTIGWIIVITAVVAPLAIRTFRARTAD